MTPDLICGIDPGVTGGISILERNGSVVGSWKMPETEDETRELLAEFAPRLSVVMLEKVNPFTGKDRVRGVASTGKFMQHYGFLRGLLAALMVRRDDVRPQEWQKALGCLTGGNKAISRQKAQQLFPGVKVTNGNADSLLLAEYARRQAWNGNGQ